MDFGEFEPGGLAGIQHRASDQRSQRTLLFRDLLQIQRVGSEGSLECMYVAVSFATISLLQGWTSPRSIRHVERTRDKYWYVYGQSRPCGLPAEQAHAMYLPNSLGYRLRLIVELLASKSSNWPVRDG